MTLTARLISLWGALLDCSISRVLQVEALTKLFDHMADLEPKRDRDAAAASPSASAAAPAEASAAPPPLAPDPDEVPIQAFRKAGGKWAKWCAGAGHSFSKPGCAQRAP